MRMGREPGRWGIPGHQTSKGHEKEEKGRSGMKGREGEYNLQLFQRGLNVREFEEDGPVRDMLIVKHKTDSPDSGREADVLGAGQVVQNNLGLGLGGHVVLHVRSPKRSIEEVKCILEFPICQLKTPV